MSEHADAMISYLTWPTREGHTFNISHHILYHIISYLKFIVPPLHYKRPWVHWITLLTVTQVLKYMLLRTLFAANINNLNIIDYVHW